MHQLISGQTNEDDSDDDFRATGKTQINVNTYLERNSFWYGNCFLEATIKKRLEESPEVMRSLSQKLTSDVETKQL